MKTIVQELPKPQKDVILHALSLREIQLQKELKIYNGHDLEDIHKELSEIKTLKIMLQYKVDVIFNYTQYEHFAEINKINYPEYNIEPKII